MTAPDELDWQEWRPKDLPSTQARFTGFGRGGNGYALLDWLHGRGVKAVRDDPTRDDSDILLDTRKREDARMSPGDWLIDGPGDDIYPREDKVNEARFDPPSTA